MGEIFRSKLNKSERKPLTKTEKVSIVLSSLAIIISLLNVYFNFFRIHNDLYVTFVEGHLENDSTIIIQVIFSNKGNQTETVVGQELGVEKEKGYFTSLTDFDEKSMFATDPVILKPGEQQFRSIKGTFRFSKSGRPEWVYKEGDVLQLYLVTNFINSNSVISDDEFLLGVGIINSKGLFSKPTFWYKSKRLYSDIVENGSSYQDCPK